MSVLTLPALSANGHRLVLAISAMAMLPMKLLRIVIGVSGFVKKDCARNSKREQDQLHAERGIVPVGDGGTSPPRSFRLTASRIGSGPQPS